MKNYYIYILECSNSNYYTGYTTDLERRYQEHQQGTIKCKYTRSFPPVRLAASWEIGNCLADALKLERKIKSLSKQQKKELINNPQVLMDL